MLLLRPFCWRDRVEQRWVLVRHLLLALCAGLGSAFFPFSLTFHRRAAVISQGSRLNHCASLARDSGVRAHEEP